MARAMATLGALVSSPLRFLSALRLTLKAARESPDRALPYHLVYLAEACLILRWLRAAAIAHLHAHFGTNSAEVAMLVNALGGPSYSFTVHGPEEFERPMGLAEKIHRSAFVAAMSSYGRSQLYLRLPYADWPKAGVVHCGLERAFYEVAAVPIPEAPRLVCVGRLCEAKGQVLLVEAAAALAAKNVRFELVLVGDGPLRGDLERAIARHGLGEHVRITGWLSSTQVREQLLAARALVLPSFAEGLPVVIMEAMALRRPVLSTYIAGIPELVVPAQTGWLFPAGSLDALVAALEACLAASTERLQSMGDAARTRVIERHSIDTEARKLMDLFLAAAGRH